MAARAGKLPEASKNPPLRAWTQEASLLAQTIMEIRGLKAVLIAVNSKEGAAQPKVESVPVPVTAMQMIMERARDEARLSKHDSLVRRLLGDRANKQ